MGIWYRTGTVALTNASAAVTGTGTAFTSNVKPGDGITFDAGATWYEVLSIASNTSLTLATNYAGSTASGVSYASDRRSPKWTWPSEFERVVELLTAAPLMLRGTGDPAADLGSDGAIYLDTAGAAVWYHDGVEWLEFLTTAGADGADGATILTGAGAPSGGVGSNGDIYVDTTNGTLYGVKTGGAWPTPPTSLRGLQGATGLTGATGATGVKGDTGDPGKQTLYGTAAPSGGTGLDGDFYIETTNNRLYGPKAAGAWPGTYVSLIGPQGDTGDTGATGASGSTVEVWGLDVSAASGALTVALKRPDGSDPSGGSPVTLKFKNTTLASGTPAEISRTSALSLVLPSGATAGFDAGVPSRLWFVAFNDGGTMRIAAVNCRGAAAILAINESVLASASSVGTGSDSAETFYSDAVISSKALRILGFAQWNSGLSVAGTWTAPDVVHVFTPGTKKPGDVVRQHVHTVTAHMTGTTTIPADATIPQSTEGTLFAQVSYTAHMPGNVLDVDASFQLSNSAANTMALALFRDSESNASAVGMCRSAASYPEQVRCLYRDITPAAARIYSLRAGGGSSGTTYLNGVTTVNPYGGRMPSRVTLTEIMA